MCGISGYAGWDGRAVLPAMVEAMRHRGPDDQGVEDYPGAGLGFARLSIIDLAGGHQPLTGEDGRVHVVVNGEIYNHKALRKDLEAAGHRFTTHSDSEAVLHAYEEWGIEAFPRLEGMFAIAVWDERDGTMTLARDRMGKKPLYWARHAAGLVFASEVKSILTTGISRDINPEAVLAYLASDSVPTPYSIFRNIEKVPAGAWVRWSARDGVRCRDFWPGDPADPHGGAPISAHEWSLQLESLLHSAVDDRLMADVPIGVYLSAGVDSMLVTAMAQQQSREALHSFTLRFDDASYDESAMAASFARECGLRHHEVHVGEEAILGAVDRFVDIFDEPLNDPATLVMLPLAQASAEHVKVALTGDGGDELFYGYRHLRMHEAFERLPRAVTRGLAPLQPLLSSVPDSGGYFSPGFMAQRLARGLGEPDLVARDLAWRGAYTLTAASRLLDPAFRAMTSPTGVMGHFRQIADQAPFARDDLDRWSWLYLRSYLLDTVLVKVDRATMAYGVEARSPILDHEIVEFVLRMPRSLKTGDYRNKRMMREILHRSAPAAQPAQTKHGMGVPIPALLKGPLRSRLGDLSSPPFLRAQGIFDPTAVATMLTEFDRGKRDLRKEVWGFLVFQMWFERWAV